MKTALIPALLSVVFAGFLPAPSRGESIAVQWETIYSGPNNVDNYPASMTVDSEGNVLVTGGSFSYQSSSGSAYTVKYSAVDGTILWQRSDRRIAGSAIISMGGEHLAVDAANNVIITGYTAIDYYIAKYSGTNGSVIWEKRSGRIGYDLGSTSLALDAAGNAFVTGYRMKTSTPNFYANDIHTAKYAAANGQLLWEQNNDGSTQGASAEQGLDVAVDSTGNSIITGYSGDSRLASLGYYTAKYAAANGELLWEHRRHEGTNARTHMVVVDSQDNVIVTGGQHLTGLLSTVKYSGLDGGLLWEKSLPSMDAVSMHTLIALDDANDVIFAGTLTNEAGSLNLVAKYAADDGRLIWEKQYQAGSPAYSIRYLDMTLDVAGNVFTTGWTTSSGGNRDIYTAKYAAADGSLLWEMRYNGTRNLVDYGQAVTVDGEGNVIVTGSTYVNYNAADGSGTSDIYTVKYTPVGLDLDDDNDGLPDSWEIAHFGGTEGQGALDDTDGDGAVELLELAFGTDPRSGNSVPTPAVVVEGGYLTTTIAKQPGVGYLVETGTLLESGFSSATTTVLTDDATTLKVRDNVPAGTQPARFLRVRVTAAP